MTENDLARIVYQKCLKLHRELDPGLLESVYEECLYRELIEEGLTVDRQKEIPIRYSGKILDSTFRDDLIFLAPLRLRVINAYQF